MLRDESGVIAVIFAICIPLFVALAALAIDMAYGYKVRNTVQVSASAAALAGVSQLNDANEDHDPNNDDDPNLDFETYRQEALEYAYRNMQGPSNVGIVNSTCGTFDPDAGVFGEARDDGIECDDIKAGHWDGAQFYAWDNTEADGCDPATETDCYIPAIMALDAVQVAARRAEANANALPLFFASALGMVETDVNTVAVATIGGGTITNGCLIALNNDDGVDQTFYINGQASVTTIGCDIRVDQCCEADGGDDCQMGAFRANGTPLVEVLATCAGEENCVDDAGIIDVCGTLLEQGTATITADTACSPDESSNFYGADQCDDPTGDSFDPLQNYETDNNWSDLSLATCDFIDFTVTKLNDPAYEYTVMVDVDGVPTPRDAVQDPDTGTWTYTLHPGTYCGPNGMDAGGNNAKAIKFAGGGSSPNIIFSHDTFAGSWPDADFNTHGVYVIKNGALDLASSGVISCEECGFFLTGEPATGDMTGSNSITLTASPYEASPLKGLFLVQDPNTEYTPEDQEVFIAGSTGGSYSGGVYIPNGKLTMVGSSESDRPDGSDCLVIIADQLEFKGGATLEANSTCAGGNAPEFAPSPLFFTLVD